MEAALPSREAELEAQLAEMAQQLAQLKAQLPASTAGASASAQISGSASAPAAPGPNTTTIMSVESVNGTINAVKASKGKGSKGGKGKDRGANDAPTPAASSARAPQSAATNGGAAPAKTRSKGTGKGSKPKRGYLATDVFDRLTSPTRLAGPAAAIYKRPEPQRRTGDGGNPQGGAQPSYAVTRLAERPHPFIKSKPKKKKKKQDDYGISKVTKRPHPFLSAAAVKVSVFDRLSSPTKRGASRPAAAVYSNLSPERAGIHRRPNEAVAASHGSPQATFASGATGSTDAREHLKAMKAAAAGRPSSSPAKTSTTAGMPPAATPQADRTKKKKKKKMADPYDVLKPARRPHPLLDTDSPYRATRRGQLVLKASSLSPPRPFAPPKEQKHAALDTSYDKRSHAWAERQALLREFPIPVTRSGAAEVGSSDDSSGSGDSDADDAVSFESEADINALHAKLRDAIDRYRDGEPVHADANEGLHAMATEMPSKLLSHAPSDKSWPNPLVYAVTQRKVGATMALLESGAKPTALGGRTLLHVAVDTPEPSMKLLDALLEFGQDINAKDTAQNTPLLLAVAAGASEAQLAAQELLIECGADPKATNAEGKSVTMLASPELRGVLRDLMGDDIATDFGAELDDGDGTILPLPSSVDGDGESLDLADNGYPLPPPLPRKLSRGGSEHIYEFDADSHVSPAVAIEEQRSFLDSIAAFGAELDDDDDDIYEAVVAGLGTAPQTDGAYEVPVSSSNPAGRYKIDYEEIDDGPTKPDYEPMDEDDALYEATALPARGRSIRDWALPKPPAETAVPPPVAQEEGLSPAELARRKRAAKKAAAEETASNATQQAFVDSVSTFGDSGGDVPPTPPPRHSVIRSASVASSQSPLGFMEHNPDYEHAGTIEPVSPALKDGELADGFTESMGKTRLLLPQVSLATKYDESVRLAWEAEQMRVQREATEGASLAEVATTEQNADAVAAERRRWSTKGSPLEHASSTAEEIKALKESLELQQVQMQLAAAKATTLAAEKAQVERDAQLERERQATEAAADAERYRQEIAMLQKSREGEKADYDRKLAESSRASAEQARAEAAEAEKGRAAEELARLQKLHEEERLVLATAMEHAQREKAQLAEKMARENAEALEKQRASSELEFERQALEHERREADRVSAELAEMKALHEERERMATETSMIKAEQEREKAAALAELEALRAQAEAERVEREKQALLLQALKDEQAREQEREAKVEAELAALKAQKVRERQEREKAAAQAEELERQRARQKEEEAQAAAEIARQQAESDRVATEHAAAQLAQERAKYEAEAEAARLRAAEETASLRAELKEQERQVTERAAQAAAAREAAQAANLAQEKKREERLTAEMVATRAEKEGIAAELAATRLESQRSRDEASAEIERLQAAQRASEIKAEKQAEQRLAAEKATAEATRRDKEALAIERATITEAAQQEREQLAAEEASIVAKRVSIHDSSRPPSGIIDSDSDDGEKSTATQEKMREVASAFGGAPAPKASLTFEAAKVSMTTPKLALSSSDEGKAAPQVPSADPDAPPTPQDDEMAQAQLATERQPSTTSEDALGQARRKLADAMKRAQTTVSSGKTHSTTVRDALERARAKRNSVELKLSSDGTASKHSDAIARAQARRAATAAAAAGEAGAKRSGRAKAGPSGDLYSDDSDTDSVSSAGRSPAKSPTKPAGTGLVLDPVDRKAAVREVALARAKAKRAEILAKVKRGEGSRSAAGSR